MLADLCLCCVGCLFFVLLFAGVLGDLYNRNGSFDLIERVQQQAASVEETSATMEEMNTAVQNNTASAQNAAAKVSVIQKESIQASEVMKKTIDAMVHIQSSSHEIAEIVSLIDGIAFQTNLLALNAAVEAARAGENGRGFAVVAGEVRALAQKSADAAKQIRGLIEHSVESIDEGTKLASESGEVMNGITSAIEEITHTMGQIATASSEQAEGVELVYKAIHSIDGATQQSAALVEETSSAAENMTEQAKDLRKTMAFFKTNHTTTSHAVIAPPAAPKVDSQPKTEVKTLEAPKEGAQKPAKLEQKPTGADEWEDF